MRKAFKILIGKHEQKKTLGRRRRRWEVTITMDLRGIRWAEDTG
jgi:hypothetical protein